MTQSREPGLDPQLVARLSGQFATLGQQLTSIAGDLSELQSQLSRIDSTALAPSQTPVEATAQPEIPAQVAASSPAQPQWPTYPQPGYQQPAYQQPPYVPPGYQQQPGYQAAYPGAAYGGPAYPGAYPGGAYSQPQVPGQVAQNHAAQVRPGPKRQPWWQRDGMISRILAVSGAGVTLIGVVMLLVLAAEAGWFTPPFRVALGAVFSAVLVAIGVRVFNRPGGRIGGIAVAATGIAGLYLDILAVTTLYGWLAAPIGLVVAFGIAACAVTLAVSWNSQPFASLILAGVAILAPIVTDGISIALIAFFVVTYLASFSAQLGRNWPVLQVVRTIPVVAALLAATSAVSSTDAAFSDAVWLLVASVVVALFGLGSSIVLLRRASTDSTAVLMIAVSALPLVLSGDVFDRWTVVVIQVMTAAIFAASIVLFASIPMRAKSVIAAIATLALYRVCFESTGGDARSIVLLVVALALVVASSRGSSTANGSAQLYFAGLAFAVVGGIRFFVFVPAEALTDSAYEGRTFGMAISAILFIAVLGVTVQQGAERGFRGRSVEIFWVVAGLMTLYAMMAATVSLGSVIGGETGFFAGQCITSIEWMSLATGLLILGLRSEKYAHTALLAGLSLTAASIAKLFLFDLEAQNGLFRVFAFIVVGLLLLVAGTRYAKVFAEREASDRTSLDSPEQVIH